MALQNCVPFLRMWVVYDEVVLIKSPIVFGCVLNQSHKHWLLANAL
jgi:hypothetical protein